MNGIIFYRRFFPKVIRSGITTGKFGDFKDKSTIIKLSSVLKIPINQLHYLNQIHSSKIVTVNSFFKSPKSADGLLTTTRKVVLLIKTADCIPLLAYDFNKNLILAMHLGRLGVTGGYIKKAIKKLVNSGCRLENLLIHIGPHICRKCYPVNMKKILLADLLNSGVLRHNIRIQNQCTYSEKGKYFSHRRGDAKRQATFIYLK